MRESKSTYTYTCDRCGKKAHFRDESADDLEETARWQSLNTGMFSLIGGQMFDLCPDCFESFKKEFMTWLPPAFRKALDG